MGDFGFGYEGPSWSMACRNVISDFGEFFSAFSKHIAPTYRHDRCERSVQMRLYSMSKREFFFLFCMFFASLTVMIFIGLAGPPITSEVRLNGKDVVKDGGSPVGPYILHTPSLSSFSQQLWVIAVISRAKEDASNVMSIDENFVMGAQIAGIASEGSPSTLHTETHNRTRTLHCHFIACSELVMLHLGYLEYSNYILTINFTGLEDVIANVTFYLKHYNDAFTEIEIWARFAFLCVTFLFLCWFNHLLRRFYWRDWSIEQKWMVILLPLLLLYNNPLFPLTFLVNSWLPGMIDAVFQASFLCALLLFWLCIYHGIRQNKRHILPFYLPKILIVGMLWLAACTLAVWQVYNEQRDPTYSTQLDTGNFQGFKYFFFSMGSLYVIYLLFLLVRAYAELRSMPYFDVRLKFMTVLMVFIIAMCIAITVLRFGVGVLEDNFVARLSTQYKNSAEFMLFYGSLNMYLYTMAIVYSPSANAVLESNYRDDPSFSMLNDSDEDVIYGSDDDGDASDTHPLRSGRKATRSKGQRRSHGESLFDDDDGIPVGDTFN